MRRVLDELTRLVTDTSGQDLLEYSMLIGLIALVALGAVTQLGFVIKTTFWDNIVAANI
jgi:Flp pilus assembly pilin Flp